MTDQFIVRHTWILNSEAQAEVSDDIVKAADINKRVAQQVLNVSRNDQKQGLDTTDDEQNGRGKDHDNNEEEDEQVKAWPAVEVHQQHEDNNHDKVKSVNENVQKDAVHVVAVVMMMMIVTVWVK